MKREFLRKLKVAEQPLPEEVIDAIMEENGRDITKAKADAVKPYSDYEDIKKERDDLKAQQGENVVDGKTAQQWKEAHDQAVSDHQKELDGIKFQNVLDSAITAAKGRNQKAIKALLDIETLKKSANQESDIAAALEALKKESGYMFETETPPPYSRGAGTQVTPPAGAANSLAGALREKYSK